MSNTKSFLTLTIIVHMIENSQIKTKTQKVFRCMDCHIEYTDYIWLKMKLKIQPMRWPRHLVSKKEIPRPEQDPGCQETNGEA